MGQILSEKNSKKNYYLELDKKLFFEVQKLKDGDYSSYDQIYELSKNYLYAKVKQRTDNQETIEDILQETYIVIYKEIGSLREVTSFLPWAGRIANNIAARYIKKYYSNQNLVMAGEDDADTVDFPYRYYSDDHEEFIPESVLENQEQRLIIANIIEGLSKEQKLCVQYYYFDEMSVNEIADLMGCSTGTVKSRLNYARKSLKVAIEKFEISNDVKLYSLSALPIFYIVFREMAEYVAITGGTIGAGVVGGVIAEKASSGAAVAGGSVAEGASASAAVAGGTVASTSSIAGTSTVGTFLATAVGKATVAVATVAVSGTVAVSSASVSTQHYIEEKGHAPSTEEVFTNVNTYIENDSLETLLNQLGVTTDLNQEISSPESDILLSEYEELKEFSDTNVNTLQSIDEDLLQAINGYASACMNLESAFDYCLTAEQNNYLDSMMASYHQEVDSLLESAEQYSSLMDVEDSGKFASEYIPDYISYINQMSDLIQSFANVYYKDEVKAACANYTAADMESAINQGYGIGDVIMGDLSESTQIELSNISLEYLGKMNEMIEWSNRLMEDPEMAQYFQLQ